MSTQTLTDRFNQEYAANMSWLTDKYFSAQQKVSAWMPKSKAGRTAFSVLTVFAVLGVIIGLGTQEALADPASAEAAVKATQADIDDGKKALFWIMAAMLGLAVLLSIHSIVMSMFRR